MECEKCKNSPTPYHTACAVDIITRLREELEQMKKAYTFADVGWKDTVIKLEQAERERDELRKEQQEQIDIVMGATGGLITCRNGSKHIIHDGCLYCELANERSRAEQAERERDDWKHREQSTNMQWAKRERYFNETLATERKFIKDLYECRYEPDKLLIMLERNKAKESK